MARRVGPRLDPLAAALERGELEVVASRPSLRWIPRYWLRESVELVEDPRMGPALRVGETMRADWSEQTRCLWDFIRIPTARDPATRAAKWAARYGPLHLCPHSALDYPLERGERSLPWHTFRSCPDCNGARSELEPVEGYIRCARHLRAVLSITADLRTPPDARPPGRPSDADFEDLQVAHQIEGVWRPVRATDWVLDQISALQWAANVWLADDEALQVSIEVPHNDTSTGIGPVNAWLNSLGSLGTLASQLVAALQSRHGLYRCDRCDTPHPRRRRPLPGDPVICDPCKPARKREREHRRYRVSSPEVVRRGKHDRGEPAELTGPSMEESGQ